MIFIPMSPLNSAHSFDEADHATLEHAAHSLSELTKNNIIFHKIYSLAKVSVCTSSSLEYVFVVVSYDRSIRFCCLEIELFKAEPEPMAHLPKVAKVPRGDKAKKADANDEEDDARFGNSICQNPKALFKHIEYYDRCSGIHAVMPVITKAGLKQDYPAFIITDMTACIPLPAAPKTFFGHFRLPRMPTLNNEVRGLRLAGYRFNPTDLELIKDYLFNMVYVNPLLSIDDVFNINVYGDRETLRTLQGNFVRID
ncbi:hypothetical protein QYF36_002840 [Acer negundo]|nr:hypothetical protein QYF36_002840 [Acer negundo]